MRINELVLAGNNKGKAREFAQIFQSVQIRTLNEMGISHDTIEDCNTFHGNAFKKARQVFAICRKPTIADDSGLCVTALNGAPGVFSARYCGDNSTDESNVRKLLSELDGVTDRAAKFVCCVCLVISENDVVFAFGECNGTIALSPMGASGFGYDPVFIPLGYRQTMAQLSADVKNCISHRKYALDNLKNKDVVRKWLNL